MGSNVPSTTLDDVNVNAPASTSSPQFNAYAKRVITVTFQLNQTQGSQAQSFGGADTLSVSGLRTFARITKATIPATGTLYLRVQGLTLSQINTLTVAGTTYAQKDNSVKIEAGDAGGSMSTIFVGNVNYAYPDFNTQPDVAFIVNAVSTGVLQLKPTTPVTFPGSVPADQALTRILQSSGVTLQNNGVNATLQSPYFPGTAWQQVQRALKAASATGYYDPIGKKLTVWPKNGGPQKGSTILISPKTGMIGYPQFQNSQIVVRTIFAPDTITDPSQFIKVESQLASAQGTWQAYNVDYVLSSETPGGPWEMVISGAPTTVK